MTIIAIMPASIGAGILSANIENQRTASMKTKPMSKKRKYEREILLGLGFADPYPA